MRAYLAKVSPSTSSFRVAVNLLMGRDEQASQFTSSLFEEASEIFTGSSLLEAFSTVHQLK